jgi:hypothetical protein
MLVGLDVDDPCFEDYFLRFQSVPRVRLFVKERNANLHERINELLPECRGEYLFVLNDDCRLVSKGWDECAYRVLDGEGDVVYGRTYDNSIDRVNQDYAAFPIMSKRAANKLGFIMDDTFGNHGSDVVTYRIYEQAGKVIDLPCVQIDHVFHNSPEGMQARSQDQTAVEMFNRTIEDRRFSVQNLFTLDVTEKANKLL